jgi:hypothetical protein
MIESQSVLVPSARPIGPSRRPVPSARPVGPSRRPVPSARPVGPSRRPVPSARLIGKILSSRWVVDTRFESCCIPVSSDPVFSDEELDPGCNLYRETCHGPH